MNFSRTGRRLAVSGVAAAIAAAGLVGASTTAAHAADPTKTGSSTYACTFPIIGEQQVPVDLTIPNISAGFPTIPAGLPLSQGSLSASYVFHANPAVAGLLPSVTGLTSDDLSLLLGKTVVKVADFALGTPVPGTELGSLDIPGTATNSDFSVPGAGVYQLTMPKTFTLKGNSPLGPVAVPCTTTDAAVLDTLTVIKNDAIVSAKAPAKVKKGKAAKVVATVAGGVSPFNGGKVTVLDGKKKLGTAKLSSAGKAVYTAKGLKVGKHNIVVKYAGDAFRTAGKSKAVVVKVVK